MNNDTTFRYSYSAKENKEVQEIRNKYLPPQENKIEELKRLDNMVQMSGMTESLCVGIGGVLVFGLGMCLTMQVVGHGAFMAVLGIMLSILGGIGMITAYPVYRMVFNRTKAKYAPRILELTEELIGGKNSSV